MTSVSAGHIILTPTQPVGGWRPKRESNPGPPHQESRAQPQSCRAPHGGKKEVWLVGFLTSSSTTRLYRGRAPRQSVKKERETERQRERENRREVKRWTKRGRQLEKDETDTAGEMMREKEGKRARNRERERERVNELGRRIPTGRATERKKV